jgi:DNA repair photolyase
VALISEFDPWHSALCTCPSKLTFNPNTGCDHGCVYCYASSYIPEFPSCRPKRNLSSRLRKEADKLKGETISMANSSDPYPTIEEKTAVTRECLEILSGSNCKLQIVTKSNLVVRDIDLLKKIPSMVSMTITTDNDNIAAVLEPNAPRPSERLEAIRILASNGIPTSARIDPIIPFLNDKAGSLIKKLASLDIKHITCSTYKVKTDNWRRLSKAFPELARKLEPLYFGKGERTSGYIYLPKDLRLELMKNVRTFAKQNDISFGTCREGLSFLNTATCDGSWLTSTK